MKITLACTLRQRLTGLLRLPRYRGSLLLVPCHDIHTFGMQGPIDVAFLDEGLVVVASYRNVAPRRRIRCKGALATLERHAAPGPWPDPGQRLVAVTLDRAAAPGPGWFTTSTGNEAQDERKDRS